jgi:PAS domain S-box-containing protein
MAEDVDFVPATGEIASLIRTKDWSKTTLGPPKTWPASLRTLLRLVLTSRYAMWMGWGPDLVFFYNDAYARQTLGAKHPWALGRPAREVWAEVWAELDVRVKRVFETGEATWDEGLLLFLERSGYPEETYHTFSYSPAPGDSPGEVAGLFCVVVEETDRVIGERRIALLQEFAALLGQTNSTKEVVAAVERCLTENARDIPFSLTYLFDDEGKLAARVSQTGFAGLGASHPAAPEQVAIGGAAPWPFHDVLASGTSSVVALAGDHTWPTGAWEKAPSHALVVPIAYQGHARPAGVFVAGLNPHRVIDKSLQSFVELFVGQLAAALSNARAYAEERRRADALAEIDLAKTAFFSNVSHEFRTPLTLMLGPTEDALGSPERALRGADLDTVHRNELRLLKLVNALLDFARIESSRIQASYEPTDLAALTTDLASSFRSAIERAGLAFEVDCPRLTEPVFVDRDMWEKIVLNLLSNALKFTFDGRIGVSLRSEGDVVRLVVSDTGVGVAEAEVPRLFERFHRIEGTRARTHEGSGIGLALVHELVRLHGGAIDVVSRPQEGTTFTISIPRGDAHLPQERVGVGRPEPAVTPVTSAFVEEAMRWTKVPETPASGPDGSPGARARILVADDNADMRDYIARLLRERWAVEAVSDGLAALEAIRKSEPALVLSDVMMPGLDGFGLLRAVRADPKLRSIPFILLSARAGEEASTEGLKAGADDYIVKPFAARDLVIRVASKLAAAEARHEVERARDRAEELAGRLFNTSQRLRAAQQVAGIGIFDWDQATGAIFWSPELYKLMGLEPESAPATAELWTARLYDETDRQTAWDTYRDALAARHNRFEFEVRFRQADGGSRWVRLSTEVQYDAEGRPMRTLGAVVDVQILKEAAAARARALADAERTSRAKDEFLATMSHELRTPLNAMLGWARILKARGVDEKRLEHGLTVIERNAETQARLVSDLLDVSRIISGKLRLTVRKVPVAAIVLSAMDVVRQAADAKGVQMTADLDPDLGSIAGDPDRLQQIVWNLLANAVKFTPARGSVFVSAAREDSIVCIRVTDNGAGIAPEHLPVIFERFQQVDSSTTRVHGGLGLGLAIVRHLTEAHGGTVTAASEGLGKGATFTVNLPLRAVFIDVDDDATGGPHEVGVTEKADAAKRLRGISILVVDDDEDSLDLLRVVLEEAGASVTTVPSAARALAGVERSGFDLVVSDIGMPEMDGYAFIRKLRERRADLPAIALTAYARAEDAERARRAGYQEHVAKPVNGVALVSMLERLLPLGTVPRG